MHDQNLQECPILIGPYDNPLLPSDNQPMIPGQFSHNRTNSLASFQCERYLPDEPSNRNFSSGFYLEGLQHLQDGEHDVSSPSSSQSGAGEIWNVENRLQPPGTEESERNELETEEDELGRQMQHDNTENPDCGVEQTRNDSEASSDKYAKLRPNIGSLHFQTASLSKQDVKAEPTDIKLQLEYREMDHQDVMAYRDDSFTYHPQPAACTGVSSEKRSSLMEKYDAVNKRIEKNPHFTGANVEFELQTRNRHYRVADINFKSTVNNVRVYREVMENETNRMMTSIDTLESVTFDLLGTERKRVFFDLLDCRLLRFESSATISDFIPNMIDPSVIQEVIYFSAHKLSMINRLKTLLLSCPDGERLRQISNQEFIPLIQTVVASAFNESTTRRPIFSMVDSEVFERALEGIPQDFINNLQPEERVDVPGEDNNNNNNEDFV